MTQSSMDHCRRCLAELRLRVRAPKMPTHDMAAQLEMYAEDIRHYPPDVVERACRQWARERPTWPATAELLEACERVMAASGRPAIEAPRRRDALNEALGYLPGIVARSIDCPTELNGHVPWSHTVSRDAIMRAIARAWASTPAPPRPPERDPARRAKAAFAQRLGDALGIAVRSGDPSRIEPGRDLHPGWRDMPDHPWWSHDGLRELVEDVEAGRYSGGFREFAVSALARHLAEGRMPADVADRAIALMNGQRGGRAQEVAGGFQQAMEFV